MSSVYVKMIKLIDVKMLNWSLHTLLEILW